MKKSHRYKDNDRLDIDKIISMLKDNCEQCKNNIEHNCGIKPILHEWEGMKQNDRDTKYTKKER